MSTATKTRTHVKPERSAKVQKIGNRTILWLTVGKLTVAYRLTPLASQIGGTAFRPEKADQGDGQAEVYDVCLNGRDSLCDCKGFEHLGMEARSGSGCKHVAALAVLLASGQLPAAPHESTAPGVLLPDPQRNQYLGGF